MPALPNPFQRERTLATTPWQRREEDGLYVGRNGQVWLYRSMPLAPMKHEDPSRRLEEGRRLESLLEEIGEKSKDVGQGLRMLSRNRSIHLAMVTYDRPLAPPEGTPARLETFMHEVLAPVAPGKTVLVGVQLQSSALATVARAQGGLAGKAKALLSSATDDAESSLDAYRADQAAMEAVFKRNAARVPTEEELDQLEAWFNHGITADVSTGYTEQSFHVVGGAEYEISAVMSFDKAVLQAPASQWLLDAATHPDPAVVISVRAELEPATVTRARLRRQRRKLIAAEEEEAATGDLGREENASTLSFATQVEEHVRRSRTAWLTGASVLMARRVSSADETYADMLRQVYEIDSKVLEHRQLEALHEMLPTSSVRSHSFEQDINPAMLAYGGVTGFSRLGDDSGAFLGHVDPDWAPLFIDPFAAAQQNFAPVMGVFGDPGSGKTFACQMIAGEIALGGTPAIFVNPKPGDSLAAWAQWVSDRGAQAQVISMSKLEARGGAFDPFRFCEPLMASEILTRHIQTVLGYALSPQQNILLRDGLRRGAEAGAQCAAQALAYVTDEQTRQYVEMMAASSTLFALGFGREPQEPWGANGGLTLIEFDRELALPAAGTSPSEYEPAQREALAAMRLVTRASIEILLRAGGGVLVVDEAHHFLGSPEGKSALERLGREGRSMGLLPIFATQRVTDLLQVDMESFMSRVLAMKLTDAREATAALTLCRLEATPARLEFLRGAGPRAAVDGMPSRSALGIFRDLRDRHAAITIGPVPEPMRLAMSTNRTDRQRRAEAVKEGGAPTQMEMT